MSVYKVALSVCEMSHAQINVLFNAVTNAVTLVTALEQYVLLLTKSTNQQP